MSYINCVRALVTTFAFIGLFASSRAEYLAKGSKAAAGTRNICLIYNSSYDANGVDTHRAWKTPDFVPILAYTATSGRIVAPMFDSVLVLPLRAQSKRGFVPGFGTGPSTVDDWVWYADVRLFGTDDHLRKLDAAVGQVKAALNMPNLRCKVILTLPYPDRAQTTFGALPGTSINLNFVNTSDRLLAIQWYIGRVTALWGAAGFQNLEFIGWYWLQETIGTSDSELLPLAAAAVHTNGRKFFWIPYFNASGYSNWRQYGFDAAILQPNYFFTETIPYSRLTDTADRAEKYGLGVELEFDGRVLSSESFRTRYQHYLAAGRSTGFQSNALTAWYMGGDALLQCALSTTPEIRAIYDDTWFFISQVPIPGDANKSRIIDIADVKAILSVCAGIRRSTDTTLSFGGADANGDAAVNLLDAARTLRYAVGLDTRLP